MGETDSRDPNAPAEPTSHPTSCRAAGYRYAYAEGMSLSTYSTVGRSIESSRSGPPPQWPWPNWSIPRVRTDGCLRIHRVLGCPVLRLGHLPPIPLAQGTSGGADGPSRTRG